MRIAFFGSSNFSCHVLRTLLQSSHQVSIVITQPDSPAGRGMQLRPTVLAAVAAELNLDVLKPQKLRGNTALVQGLRQLELDAIAVASYGKIIPRSLLELTPWPLNVHPSPLPLLRGASPLRSALLLGWQSTEVCIMRMTARIDDGPLLSRAPLPIEEAWNYVQTENRAGELGGTELARALTAIESGTAEVAEQDHSAATYCQTFARADTWLDWNMTADRIHAFVRAWDPDIGALTMLDSARGPRTMKVWRTEVAEESSTGKAGQVVAAERHRVIVQAGRGRVAILELQPENKPRMSAAQFLAGNQLSPGDQFGTRA